MNDGVDVACISHAVTHTWTDIISRYAVALGGADPRAALGAALSQFAGTPEQLVDMLRNPERDARTRALAYAVEQFAGVDDPRNPLRGLNAEGIHGDLANRVQQALTAITHQDAELGGKLRQAGLEFALPSLLERDPSKSIDLARTGVADDAAERERRRKMPRRRGISGAPSGPPEVPVEYVPCGQKSRFGNAESQHKVAAHRTPSPPIA
jgi:hypothetical protein